MNLHRERNVLAAREGRVECEHPGQTQCQNEEACFHSKKSSAGSDWAGAFRTAGPLSWFAQLSEENFGLVATGQQVAEVPRGGVKGRFSADDWIRRRATAAGSCAEVVQVL